MSPHSPVEPWDAAGAEAAGRAYLAAVGVPVRAADSAGMSPGAWLALGHGGCSSPVLLGQVAFLLSKAVK